MGQMDDYTDRESDRLSRVMVNNPHAAADELRDQLQQLDPRSASDLVRKTKDNEFVGGLGDLQIQVELTQNGCDSGFRNVTMATPDGVEQIAEMQTNQPYCGPDGRVGYNNGYRVDPLAAVAGMIVGDLLWGQRRGYDMDDERYRGWQDRERFRENDWNDHRDDFRRNWQDQGYRNQFQNQDWHQNSWSQNNTYITNNTINNTRPLYPTGSDQRPHGPGQTVAPVYDPRMNGLGRIAPIAPASSGVPAYDARQHAPNAGQGQLNRPAENPNLARPNPQQQQQQLEQQHRHEPPVPVVQPVQRKQEVPVQAQPQHHEAPPPPARPASAPQPDARQLWEQQHKKP